MMYKLVMLFVIAGLMSCNQNTALQQHEAIPAQAETKTMPVDNVVVVQESETVKNIKVESKPKLIPQAVVASTKDKKVEPAKAAIKTTVKPASEKVISEETSPEKVVEQPKHVEGKQKKVIASLVQGKQPLRSEPVVQPEPIMAVGDFTKGKKVAKKCMSCHTFNKGGKKKVGPNLFGIVGRKKGSAAGFKYGTYLKNVGGVWTEADLRAWVKDSKAVAKTAGKKTKMPSQKITAQKADDLMAYLKTLQ